MLWGHWRHFEFRIHVSLDWNAKFRVALNTLTQAAGRGLAVHRTQILVNARSGGLSNKTSKTWPATLNKAAL